MRRLLPFALLLALVSSAVADDLPQRPAHYVTDQVGILQPSEIAGLEKTLVDIEKNGLAQMIIYIDHSVPKSETLEEYTLRLTNAWGVGNRELNDGVALFVFTDERRMRIEVGLGLEKTLTNEAAKKILDNDLTPAFREGQFAQGLAQALDSIAKMLDVGEASARRP